MDYRLKENRSSAFYYAHDLPLAEATLYPSLVVQPEHISSWQIEFLNKRKTEVFAYISVGESSRKTAAKLLAENAIWNTAVVDLGDPVWQRELYQHARSYKLAGFTGLFLDTLDSFHLVDKDLQPAQRLALIEIIKKLSEIMQGNLILNRGFDVLPDVVGKAKLVVAEGLYSHYLNTDNSYGSTTKEDRAWLIAKLEAAQQLGFKVQVIDYARTSQKRVAIAKKIVALGFKAWVADGQLASWGVSEFKAVPRKIMTLFDSRHEPYIENQSHVHLDSQLEYLGYHSVYFDVSKGLPSSVDSAIYAGILIWTQRSVFYSEVVERFLLEQLHSVPMLLIGAPPKNTQLLNAFGVVRTDRRPPYSVKYFDPNFKSEMPVRWLRQDILSFIKTSSVASETLFSLVDRDQREIIQVISTQAGAMVPGSWPLDTLPNGIKRWRLDPSYLLKKGLRLADIPVADVTTETGRRTLLVHIDGDGFNSKAFMQDAPLVSEVVFEQVLKKYRIPTTVSVIEAEVGASGLYPETSSTMENLARRIFREPYVEIASHSYSHPFYWGISSSDSQPDSADTLYGLYLPIEGYQFSLEREIIGSSRYINENLTPPDKKVKMMLWTGDAVPRFDALKIVRDAKLLNVNGGSSYTSKNHPSISGIWPIGRKEPEALYQIYAPIMNENVYTNDWTGPYYGFRDVIDTFKRTNSPQRLKPVNIYYHFYSGTYPASINALHQIYQYSLSQPHTSLYLSEYALRAEDFYNTAIAVDEQGQWYFSTEHLKTLRIPKSLGVPGVKSIGVAGFLQSDQGNYVHLVGKNPVLKMAVNAQHPYIDNGNVILQNWSLTKEGVQFSFTGYEDIEINFRNAKHCQFVTQRKRWQLQQHKSMQQLVMKKGTYSGLLSCRESKH